MNKELSELTAKVVKIEKSAEGSRTKIDTDMTKTRLDKLKEESSKNLIELQRVRDEVKEQKNLQFQNTLLLREREEYISQFKSYDHICQECFKLVSELKKKFESDKKQHDKENMDPSNASASANDDS